MQKREERVAKECKYAPVGDRECSCKSVSSIGTSSCLAVLPLLPSASQDFGELLTRAHAPSQPSRLWEPGAGRGTSGSAAPLCFKEGTCRPSDATKVVLQPICEEANSICRLKNTGDSKINK